ncbi:uncharacterized protein MYCFIDRAFT_173406 [Pseudocercospora fijiensis CIRAD86]|uniref:Uncharacterized protein n=1 Tax=Pseudocercospora fijiensis (strain CIRAD86) TaxID=383855 RepID=M2Z3L1_PSEFD|nr:uncharacterized protein MYCFIDRAFT_173406 [Pseudocercospora fijiensis CIRAD86]EME84405.1 hypothetical protein MYCFIDRAFT_173406 [Pseudocercospora fijiensis CIRAD86]
MEIALELSQLARQDLRTVRLWVRMRPPARALARSLNVYFDEHPARESSEVVSCHVKNIAWRGSRTAAASWLGPRANFEGITIAFDGTWLESSARAKASRQKKKSILAPKYAGLGTRKSAFDLGRYCTAQSRSMQLRSFRSGMAEISPDRHHYRR